MKILEAIWFTQMGELSPIGIVLGEDEATGERKAYIGTGYGNDEYCDANHIAETGGKLHPCTISTLRSHFNMKD